MDELLSALALLVRAYAYFVIGVFGIVAGTILIGGLIAFVTVVLETRRRRRP